MITWLLQQVVTPTFSALGQLVTTYPWFAPLVGAIVIALLYATAKEDI